MTLHQSGRRSIIHPFGFNVVGAAYATLAKTLKPVMKLPKNR